MATLQVAQPDVTQVSSFAASLNSLAQDQSKDVDEAIRILNDLLIYPMTLDILQKTRVGFAVNTFRKSTQNPEASALAKRVIEKWKQLLPDDTKKTKPVESATAASANASSSSSQAATSRHSEKISKERDAEKRRRVHEAAEDSKPQAGAEEDGASSASSTASAPKRAKSAKHERDKEKESKEEAGAGNDARFEVRLKCRELLAKALATPFDPAAISALGFDQAENHDALGKLLDPDYIAERIESAIYNFVSGTNAPSAPGFDFKYRSRVMSRVINLKDLRNPHLRYNVLIGYIGPERLAAMKPEELASNEVRRQIEEMRREALDKSRMTFSGGTLTSNIKCKKCGKANVTYNQVQTRSGDEPMTTFCFCNECGFRWRF